MAESGVLVDGNPSSRNAFTTAFARDFRQRDICLRTPGRIGETDENEFTVSVLRLLHKFRDPFHVEKRSIVQNGRIWNKTDVIPKEVAPLVICVYSGGTSWSFLLGVFSSGRFCVDIQSDKLVFVDDVLTLGTQSILEEFLCPIVGEVSRSIEKKPPRQRIIFRVHREHGGTDGAAVAFRNFQGLVGSHVRKPDEPDSAQIFFNRAAYIIVTTGARDLSARSEVGFFQDQRLYQVSSAGLRFTQIDPYRSRSAADLRPVRNSAGKDLLELIYCQVLQRVGRVNDDR